ncbi:hypothetical protein [Klebsiella sp. BIGb0407]|uniref:hypothetical protein n=1 Tax=Klebsiella sp. BIGb0407 TaxID=2940603 RepID=UPI0021675961|nr:hypothetical protein [Klebsiella sp. BIGb0407]MCS3430018.1 hypothetical protein [Klebsiella sp. BIGb0407]
MKKIIGVGLMLISCSSIANERLSCEYSVSDLSSGTPTPFYIKGIGSIDVMGKSFKATRPDGSSSQSPEMTNEENGVMIVDDITKIFAASKDNSNFSVSDRIKKVSEQWGKCSIDNVKKEQDKTKLDVEDQMKRITSIPWSGQKANNFFLKETHLFMLLECGWAGSVGFSTGPKPLVMLGDSYYKADSSSFKNGEYSIKFNGGTMWVTYNPQKIKGYISDSHSFTLCSAVRVGD